MFIEKNNAARRFAISDIHGCYDTFACLLDTIQITKQDQLFILGDCIDRGKQNRQVLDSLIRLQNDGYQVFVTLGNHEQAFITIYERGIDDLRTHAQKYNSHDLLQGDLEMYIHFMREFLYYIELDNFLLSHAAFNFRIENPFTDQRSMHSPSRNIAKKQYAGGKHVIHGHFIQSRQEIETNIQQRARIICIDNGCYQQNIEGVGNLCALELDTFELYFEENKAF